MAEVELNVFSKIKSALSRKGVGKFNTNDHDGGGTTETSKNWLRDWAEYFGPSETKKQLYRTYLNMEADSPIASAALDAITDTAVSGAEGDFDGIYEVSFEEENEKVAKIIEECEERTRTKEEARQIIRTILLMGDEYSEIVVQPKTMDIVRTKPIPCETMVVVPDHITGQLPMLGAFIQYDEEDKEIAKFDSWQVIHYADKKRRTDIYGRSLLYSARRIHRQLQALMDGLVINRLRMATQRYKHKIYVGSKTPEDAYRFAALQGARMKKKRRFDPETGQLIMDRTPLLEESDFFVPTGKNIDADVELLQGQGGQDRIQDVEFMQKQYFAALKTPPAYLSFEADTSGKSVIGTLDISFARTVRAAQMTYGRGQRQLYDTQIALKGIDPRTVKYDLVMAPVATVDEMRRWQILTLKAAIAKTLKIDAQLITDDEYLLREIIEVEEDKLKKILAANEKAKKEAEDQAAEIAKGQGMGAASPLAAKKPGGGGGKPVPGQMKMPRDPAKAVANTQAKKDDTSKSESHRMRVRSSHDRQITELLRSSGMRSRLEEIYSLAQPAKITSSMSDYSLADRILQEAAGIKV